MKKQIKKLQLSKSTVSNLSRQNMQRVKGGTGTGESLFWGECYTHPKFCDGTNISGCTACYSCIECPQPLESMFFPCNEPIDG
jgi:hypothetical protein